MATPKWDLKARNMHVALAGVQGAGAKIQAMRKDRGCWMRKSQGILLVLLGCLGSWQASHAAGSSVFLEELTSTELQARIRQGTHTVLIPIGGTEQNGPHMALGKHNARVRVLAGQIAQALGHAVVAPVLAYVPEGSINPPQAHMRFAGTITISEASFEALLESAARSLCSHGLRDVFFLGDHGGYRASLARVAQRLQRGAKTGAGCRAEVVEPYYNVSQEGFSHWLRAQGFSAHEIGTHAGLADTALSLAVDPASVRVELLESAGRQGAPAGVYGDPTRATAELGQQGVHMVVQASAHAIAQSLQKTKP